MDQAQFFFNFINILSEILASFVVNIFSNNNVAVTERQ